MVNAIETTWDADDNGELINGINLLCPNDGAAHDEDDDEDKRCPCCSNDDGYLEPLLNALYPVEIIQYCHEALKIRNARIRIASNTNMILVENEKDGGWYLASTTAGQSILPDLFRAHVIIRQEIFGPEDYYSVPLDVAGSVTVQELAEDIQDVNMRDLAIKCLVHTLDVNRKNLESRHELAAKDAVELGITV